VRRVAGGLIVIIGVMSGCARPDVNSRSNPQPEDHLWAFVDHIYAFVFGDDTEYSSGFSEAEFRRVRIGTPEADLDRQLGRPLSESWRFYGSFDHPHGCAELRLRESRVEWVDDIRACELVGVRRGLSAGDVIALRGRPNEAVRSYSRSPGSHNYWVRLVATRNGRVTEIVRHLYWD
jgi:hypothetical protein